MFGAKCQLMLARELSSWTQRAGEAGAALGLGRISGMVFPECLTKALESSWDTKIIHPHSRLQANLRTVTGHSEECHLCV